MVESSLFYRDCYSYLKLYTMWWRKGVVVLLTSAKNRPRIIASPGGVGQGDDVDEADGAKQERRIDRTVYRKSLSPSSTQSPG